ncbi:hypothetical protein K7X08_011075 [Anisodus acutangulus]|uniref:Uncharacterized protein n=1 Tax=Anisodus acutangulus TaxID=402998 RepID=A0A9Q1RAD7_9SOLA|nr:hypothetical protein K7X08_011075 [Anisodus acutangulus]
MAPSTSGAKVNGVPVPEQVDNSKGSVAGRSNDHKADGAKKSAQDGNTQEKTNNQLMLGLKQWRSKELFNLGANEPEGQGGK